MKQALQNAVFLFSTLLLATINIDNLYSFDNKDLESWAQTLSQTLHLTQQKYYFDVPLERAMTKMLNAFVHLDDHSGFLGPKDYKELLKSTNGNFYGIGIVLAPKKSDEDYLLVLDTIIDGPAYKAGLKKYDKIIAINNTSLDSLSSDQAVKRLRGDTRYSTVNVTVLRNSQVLKFSIKRDLVKEKHINAYHLKDHNIGYCSISLFTKQSANQLEKILNTFIDKKVKGLILDLRDNAGGVLQTAIDCAGLFVPNNSLIVSTKDKNSKITELFKTQREPLPLNMPIFVLINTYTASAAEILAGALSYYSQKRLLSNSKNNNNYIFLLGVSTYGKGSVQEVIPIGQDCAVKLTTSLYYLPNDTSIHERGIIPDFIIKPKNPLDKNTKELNKIYGKEKKYKKKKKRKEKKQDSYKHKKLKALKKDYQMQSALHLLSLLDLSLAHDPKSAKNNTPLLINKNIAINTRSNNHEKVKDFLLKHYVTEDKFDIEEITQQ